MPSMKVKQLVLLLSATSLSYDKTLLLSVSYVHNPYQIVCTRVLCRYVDGCYPHFLSEFLNEVQRYNIYL